MDLKTFVAETLNQIAQGVLEAQNKQGSGPARVNPHGLKLGEPPPASVLVDGQTGAVVQLVEFDVAVTATEASGREGGGGIVVMGYGLGGKVRRDAGSSATSRIQFKVPLLLPPGLPG